MGDSPGWTVPTIPNRPERGNDAITGGKDARAQAGNVCRGAKVVTSNSPEPVIFRIQFAV
jgi:hypothetical protein